jgi:hypothetical protein
MNNEAIVAAASGVLGAVVGAGATLLVARTERRATERAELVAALAAFLTSLDLLVVELRAAAPPRPWLRTLSHWLDRRLPVLTWLAAPLVGLIGGRTSALTDRFHVAANRLLAVAPRETLLEVEEAEEILAACTADSPGWEERWQAFRYRVQAHTRELAGLTERDARRLLPGERHPAPDSAVSRSPNSESRNTQ